MELSTKSYENFIGCCTGYSWRRVKVVKYKESMDSKALVGDIRLYHDFPKVEKVSFSYFTIIWQPRKQTKKDMKS